MKRIILCLFIFVFVFSIQTFAGENKAGWSPACEAQAVRYCNKNEKENYKECIYIERACGKQLFDIVYSKGATEDELWKCNDKLIKLLKKNGVLSDFIMYKYSYCDLLIIVLEQWEE